MAQRGAARVVTFADELSASSRLLRAGGILALLTGVGAIGFMTFEDIPFVDALYMAVITLSTVGYGEVAPPSTEGRIFTIAYIVIGVGCSFYAVAAVAEFLIEGRLREAMGRRAMQRTIQSMADHVIVCGYGRLGRAVTHALRTSGAAVVVVEQNPALEAILAEAGIPYILGSAIEEQVLRLAGIERARAIVTATPSDPDNVFISLSSRELNPQIAVHARGETEAGTRRLRLAGVEQVISLHHLGGQRIANAILRPAVVDFIELATPGGEAPIDLEEVVLGAGCTLDAMPIRALAQRGIRVQIVAIRRHGRETHLNPKPDDVLHSGDHVVVVGDQENLRRLAALASDATGG